MVCSIKLLKCVDIKKKPSILLQKITKVCIIHKSLYSFEVIGWKSIPQSSCCSPSSHNQWWFLACSRSCTKWVSVLPRCQGSCQSAQPISWWDSVGKRLKICRKDKVMWLTYFYNFHIVSQHRYGNAPQSFKCCVRIGPNM